MPPRHYGKCPGCGNKMALERHHILPRRFYGNGKGNAHITLLCTQCHRDLEDTIPRKPQLSDWKYFALVAKFLKEKAHETC